jgi:hypothetical protein
MFRAIVFFGLTTAAFASATLDVLVNAAARFSAPPPKSVHQTQVFRVLLAFLSLVKGWADRFGRRGDQRVKRTKYLQFKSCSK